MPRIAATAVARVAAATPSSSERRAPTTTCEKTSLPWSVVPKRWFHEGACRVARRLKSSGSRPRSTARSARRRHEGPTIANGRAATSDCQQEREPPGSRRRPVRARPAARRDREVERGAGWDRAATSGGPQTRVEDEVEDVDEQFATITRPRARPAAPARGRSRSRAPPAGASGRRPGS